jgi:site-specific DNA-methyltransferase (adenine-specific)
VIKPRYQSDRVTLYCADCLEVLPQLPIIDGMIVDPPYSSGSRTAAEIINRGGMSRKEIWKQNPLPNDRMTTTGFIWFMRAIGMQSSRLLKRHGSLLSFIDWRQYPQLLGALETTNLRIQNMIVWDKKNIALGNGFRNQHELIIHAANGVPIVYDKSCPNVISIDRISSSDNHPTEKPVALINRLIAVITKAGDLIADPLMGSGTTGVACMQTGRKFIGIEIDPTYYAIAEKRIKQAESQLLLGI